MQEEMRDVFFYACFPSRSDISKNLPVPLLRSKDFLSDRVLRSIRKSEVCHKRLKAQ